MEKLRRRKKRYKQESKTSGAGDLSRMQKKIIYESIKARLPLGRAAILAGVTKPTLDRWMRYGKDKRKSKYYLFRQRVLQLKAENEKRALAVIEKMSNGECKIRETRIVIGGKAGKEVTKTVKQLAPQWQAAAWLLERTLPDDYGYKKRDDTIKEDPAEVARQIKEALSEMDETIPEDQDDEE